MSDSRSGRFDELASRIKETVSNAEGHIDADGLVARVRETIGKAGSDFDTDPIVARVKEVAGHAEEKVDAGKFRQWMDEVDRDKLKGWLDEAKTLGAGAASHVEAQGDKLADRAPGAFDKLAGTVKEKLGSLRGDDGLITEEHIERLMGQLKETLAAMTEPAGHESTDTPNTIKSKPGKEDGRR
jgi:uncharacterized protein YjbJ (UPF0337 family)